MMKLIKIGHNWLRGRMGLFGRKSEKTKKILEFVNAGTDFFSGLFCGSSKVGAIVLGGAKRENIRLNDSRIFLMWKSCNEKKDVSCDNDDKNLIDIKSIVQNNFNNIDKEDCTENIDTKNVDNKSENNERSMVDDGKENYNKVVELLCEKKYEQAENFLTEKMEKSGFSCNKMTTLGVVDIFIDHQNLGLVSNYARSLDLESGEVKVNFFVSDGMIERRVFVDKNTDTLCVRIDSTKDRLLELEIGFLDIDENKKGKIDVENNYIYYNNDNFDVKFGAVGKIVTDGEIEKTSDSCVISDTHCVYFFVKTFLIDDENSLQKALKVLDKIEFEKAFLATSNYVKEKMNLTNIDFFDRNENKIENQLIDAKQGKISGNLVEKMYYYGKYLFLSGFDGKFSSGLFYENNIENLINNHIVLSRMVGFSFQCGLFDNVKVILENFCKKQKQYNFLAKILFGCDGIFVPANEDIFSGLPSDQSCCNLLDKNIGSEISLIINCYVKQSNDIEFLKDYGYDFIEGVGNFYLSFFRLNTLSHSFDSPFGVSSNAKCENTGRCIASNCTSDFVCAKVVFYLLAKLCILVGKEQDISKWEDALSKIPDVEVDNHGVIKEYNSNLFLGSNRSPYISYLFPYNVGFKPIATKKDYETLVTNTIKYKYISALGYMGSAELVDLALALFTCGEGEDGGEILNSILTAFLSPNLVVAEYDKECLGFGDGISKFGNLTIDKNICLCKCLQNMFALGSNNNICLFDTLPKYSKRMRVTGLRLSCDIVINVDVNLKKQIAKIRIKSEREQTINLFLPRGVKRVKGKALPEIDFVQNALCGVVLQKNKYKKIKIFY